jgi:hypothetical protein
MNAKRLLFSGDRARAVKDADIVLPMHRGDVP